jgi:type VI secretion system ImpM family protein
MLGALRIKPGGTWLAHGKHPAARDFFTLGARNALGDAFIAWVDRGIHSLPEQKETLSSPISWRFWSRSPQQDHLACGVVRNSFDGLRRLFPLLVLGTGRAKGWEGHWELLPLLYEETWGRIESFSAQKFTGIPQLKGGLSQLRYPVRRWRELESDGDGLIIASGLGGQLGALSPDLITTLRQTGRVMVAVETASEQDLTLAAMQLQQQFRREMPGPPSAVFMGGFIDQSYLALFTRPLGSEDFAWLWNSAMLG